MPNRRPIGVSTRVARLKSAPGGAETLGEPTLPCLGRGASRLPVPSLPSRIVTIGLVCASLYAAALGAGAFAQDEESTPAPTAAATETAPPQAPAETSTATPSPFPSPVETVVEPTPAATEPAAPTADPTTAPTTAPTEAPTQTATPDGKPDPTATPGLGVDKTAPRRQEGQAEPLAGLGRPCPTGKREGKASTSTSTRDCVPVKG